MEVFQLRRMHQGGPPLAPPGPPPAPQGRRRVLSGSSYSRKEPPAEENTNIFGAASPSLKGLPQAQTPSSQSIPAPSPASTVKVSGEDMRLQVNWPTGLPAQSGANLRA